MDKETIIIASEDVEIIDASEYKEELSEHFGRVPEVAKPLLKGAKTVFSQIEKSLYTAPAFIYAVKAAVPDVTLQAMLTDEQKQQIAKGALKLMTKKDGSLMANLINPETKKIVATIPLKSVQMAPEMTQAMTSFSTQMQMAQIAEEIQAVQLAVEEVRMGQEYDRLATASFAEAMAYQELGEHEAARKSLTYYAGFIEDTYTSVPGLVQRLDSIDPAPENYWSKTLPDISKKIKALPSVTDTKLLENK